MTALPGTDWHDVMTYCNRQWLSSYTYEGIRVRLDAENSLGPGMGAGAGRPDERYVANEQSKTVTAPLRRLISVIARVNFNDRTGTIDYVNPIERGRITPQDAESLVAVRVKSVDGKVLYETRVKVKPLSDTPEGQTERGLVDAIVIADPDAKIIELSIADKVVDTFRAGAVAPLVSNLRSAERSSGARVLAWDTDAKGDARHTYSVQVSSDGGRTWQTIAVGFTSTEIPIDYGQFGGAKQILVRLIATDGFQRFETTTPLAVDKPGSR